jgi:hypothetical protein
MTSSTKVKPIGGRDSENHVDRAQKIRLEFFNKMDLTLYRLDSITFIRANQESIKADRDREIARYIADDEEANQAAKEFSLYTKRYIESRFPGTPEALRLALAKANAMRLGRLFHHRAHGGRLDL